MKLHNGIAELLPGSSSSSSLGVISRLKDARFTSSQQAAARVVAAGPQGCAAHAWRNILDARAGLLAVGGAWRVSVVGLHAEYAAHVSHDELISHVGGRGH